MSTIHPWETRIFIDTEFTAFESPCLISIALVSEDGVEFYGECADVAPDRCSDFVSMNVLPMLGREPYRVMTIDALSAATHAWLMAVSGRDKKRVVICYDHPIDVMLLWRLIGGKPPRLKEKLISLNIDPRMREEYFQTHGGRHHALHDARANRFACR